MSDAALSEATENLGEVLIQELNEAKSGQHLTGTLGINISGNAATATKLQTARQIALTGDVTGSGNFDGSENLSIAAVIPNTGAIPGTYNSATQIAPFTINAKGQVTSIGPAITITPAWNSIQSKPTTVAGFGITDAAKSGANSDITSLTGLSTPLSASQGGTGISSYAVGDLIVASSSSALSRLAATAVGNVLLSNGVGAQPSWGKVNLTTHVTGSLPIAQGGTGGTSAVTAQTNLGLLIGTNVQAWDIKLDSISSLTGASGLLRKSNTTTYTLDTTDYYPRSGGLLTGGVDTAFSTGSISQTTSGVSKLGVNSDGAPANAAFMAFNRSGSYAVYFGLDTDNKLKVGGYSMGAVAYEILHAGNFNPGDYLPRSNGTITGDTYLNNAVYLRARNNAGGNSRVLGVNALNQLYLGSIDDPLIDNVFISAGSVVKQQIGVNLTTFTTRITGPRADFNCFRAGQGIPNSADNSTVGYAFGADGDSGLFARSTANQNVSSSVSVWNNNLEVTQFVNSNGVDYTVFGPQGSRSVIIYGGSGQINITADPGGWANALNFYANGSNTVAAAYGAQGAGATFSNLWMGPRWDNPWMTLDASNGIQHLIKSHTLATTGEIGTQTNSTTAGLVVQTRPNGTVGVDGAFITFINKDGTKAFSMGMDKDGEFKVGGGSIGSVAYKIHHDGYRPGAMVSRGTIPWTDADLARPTGTYSLNNAGNTASFGLIEFSDIGGSATRVQLIANYGGTPYASNPDDLYFRVARDTQTNWDSTPVLHNRIWHSGNITPLTSNGNISNTAGFMAYNSTPPSGQAWLSTAPYGVSQGDGRTHFGYNSGSSYVNYIRGADTFIDSQVTFNSTIRFPDNRDVSSGGTSWNIGASTWAGTTPAQTGTLATNGITAITDAGGSALFTFACGQGQLSIQLDGSIFVGDNITYNPYNINGAGNGHLLVQNNASVGGSLNVAGSVTSTYFRATKGVPAGAGDGTAVGYSFGIDGDTGLFSPGPVGAAGSTGIALYADSQQLLLGLTDRLSIFKPVISGPIMERFATANAPNGTVTCDYRDQSVFQHTNPVANYTINLVNVLALANHVITATVIVEQGATGYYPSAVQINGTAVTVKWAGGLAPIPSTNATDVFTYNLYYLGSSWVALATFTPFG